MPAKSSWLLSLELCEAVVRRWRWNLCLILSRYEDDAGFEVESSVFVDSVDFEVVCPIFGGIFRLLVVKIMLSLIIKRFDFFLLWDNPTWIVGVTSQLILFIKLQCGFISFVSEITSSIVLQTDFHVGNRRVLGLQTFKFKNKIPFKYKRLVWLSRTLSF